MPPSAKRVFRGELFDVYQWEQELFDGSTATFERLRRADTVIVFPVTPEGKIVVLEQEQPGRGPFTSVPGGRIDPGESVLEASRRELREESGYEAEELTLWFALQPASKIDWAVFAIIARGCKKVGESTPDAGERLKVREVAFDEFLNIASDESFYDREVVTRVLRAQLDPQEMSKLRELFGVQ